MGRKVEELIGQAIFGILLVRFRPGDFTRCLTHGEAERERTVLVNSLGYKPWRYLITRR